MGWHATASGLPVFAGLDTTATPEQVDAWLGEPTDATCSPCGREALVRYERRNGRCEPCRVAWLGERAAHDTRHRRPDPDCPCCDGMGWHDSAVPGELLPNGEPRYVSGYWCSCTGPANEGERILQTLRRAGVPPVYWPCSLTTWEGPKPEPALRFIDDSEGSRVLVIHGLQGRGKTHLSTAVFRELLARGWRGLWRDCPEYVDHCRRWAARGDSDSLDAELERLYSVPLLHLDDLGARRQTDFAVDQLADIIRHRHARKLPLIVTSNNSLRGLATPVAEGGAGWDTPTVSRLSDGLTVHLDGEDRRQVAGRAKR